MPVKLTQSSFVTLLEKSGLISPDALKSRVADFHKTEPGGPDEAERLAQFLIRKGDLTTWQAKKLLLGKHRGFTLGKYRLLSLLGRGGMSSVYLAEHMVMRRRCAIKVLPSKQVNDQAALTRFHQEAQAVAALDDPNIVRAYDVDKVTDGTNVVHFLVMEYVEGRSLQELVDQDGPLPIKDAIDFIAQAASGLSHAHQAGLVHRDIKPSNLLLDRNGTVKVLDMGLARFFEQSDQQSLTLQHDQRVLGTADYLSPEQAVDSHGVDTRSDIYSLGGTLYFLLAGHPPFPDGTLAQRLLAHQTKPPRPINEVRPDVPASLVRILDRMMAKSRDDRPATVAEVRTHLLDWLSQHGDAFANAAPPPRPVTSRSASKPSDPTAHGWSDAPQERFTPPPANRELRSVAERDLESDPDLGAFLTSLSSQIDPAGTESDPIRSAKTIVSTAPSEDGVVDERPAAGGSSFIVTADSDVRGGSGVRSGSAARSGSNVTGRSASRSGVRRGRSTMKGPAALLGIVAGLSALLAGGYFLLTPGATPESNQSPDVRQDDAAVANQPAPAASSRRPIEPGSEIEVGPNGHFTTIGEAIQYVRNSVQMLSKLEARTIRVAGGATYAEAITIDNSDFSSFRSKVSIICDDPQPAILAPQGTGPIVALINAESFRLKGFELAAADHPVAIQLQGYLSGSVLEDLTIHDVASTAVQANGIAGVNGKITFRNVVIHHSPSPAVGFAFDEGCKKIDVTQCRFGGPLTTGIRFTGETTDVTVSQCRFDEVGTPILFAGTGKPEEAQSLENITVTNNTFRGFDRGVAFTSPLEIGSRGVGFQKNLFLVARGPEVAIEDGATSTDLLVGMHTRFNWSEGTADLSTNAVDIFAMDGRRGITAIPLVSHDAADAVGFLQPRDGGLEAAAANAPQPKYIGAVPPAR